MNVKVVRHALPDTYLDLVKKYPLVSIRDMAHLEAACAVIDDLMQRDLDEGELAYLDTLTVLVEAFEEEHVTIPDASEADVLQELMNANRLNQTQLAKEVGIPQSTISAVLKGTRSLTKDHVARLAKRFNVPASVFLPA